MKTRSPRTPPPSSYSHSPHHIPDINGYDIASRIGLQLPEEPYYEPRIPSYISLLPPEILAEIFIYCIPEGQFPLPYRTEAPLSLTHVSSQWRSLAISIPDLWTALHINYKDPTEDIPATNTWLSRSGNKPLSLSIAIDFSEQPQQEILDVLCMYSKRWKHVRFEFSHLLCAPIYSLNMAIGDVEELSAFEFHARDISTINVLPITNLLTSAPNLRGVTWVDDMADTDTLLQLPLGRLSRLSLSMDHGILDYRQILNACYNLEHIKLTRPSSHTPHIQDPLILPKLTSFTISSDITGVLDHLVLPALREVRIHGETDKHDRALTLGHDAHSHHHHANTDSALSPTGSWDPTPLLSLIERSACSINRMSVSPPMTEAALLMCLRGVSTSLVALSVESIPIGDALLGALTSHWSHQREAIGLRWEEYRNKATSGSEGEGTGDADLEPLCPNLEELVLDTRVGCTPGMLASMVESRLLNPETENEANGSGRMSESHTSPLRLIKVVDGHKDMQRLKALGALSRTPTSNEPQTRGLLTVNTIPRKPIKAHTRGFLFRRKLCASR